MPKRRYYRKLDDTTAAIDLSQGYTAIIDLEDGPRISCYTWSAVRAPGSDYVRASTTINGRKVFMHHLLMPLVSGMEVDHIDGDALNNRKKNLRLTDHATNLRNADRHKNRIGICYNKRAKLWSVYLDEPDQKRRYLGYTKTREAALIRLEQARCL